MKDNSLVNNVVKNWYIINAKNLVLGRLACKISYILQGKHKPEYSYNTDVGDYIIVLNIVDIIITGDKLNKKIYYKHTGYIGGMKKTLMKDMLNKDPKYILNHAVKGMLPKNKIGRSMIKKLKIYKNDNHNHKAQKPIILNI